MENSVFSYIVPLCNLGDNDFTYRVKNLERLVASFPSDIELIFVEQVVDPTKPKYNINIPSDLNFKRIDVQYNTFNKLWLYNLGVRHSTSNNIILAEGDILVEDDYFTKLCEFINEKKIVTWCFGWNTLEYLDNNGKVFRTRHPARSKSEGGLIYYNKHFYYAMGMGNEWIQDLGADDNELARRAEYLSGSYFIPPLTIKHQYHPRGKINGDDHTKNPNNAPNYRHNVKIMETTIKNPQKMIDFLKNDIDRLGKPNGPICRIESLSLSGGKLNTIPRGKVVDWIIPLCNIGGEDYNHRVINLRKILRNIPEYFNVIIVEQIINDQLKKYTDDLKGEKIDNIVYANYPIFNKPWLFNIGVRHSLTTNILCSDCDILIDNYDTLVKHILSGTRKQWFIAWSSLIYEGTNPNTMEKLVQPRKGWSEGGLVYFNKQFFYELGGYNEFMQELGGNDNEIIRRAESVTKTYDIFDGTATHLFHPYNNLNKDKYAHAEYIKQNRELYQWVVKYPDLAIIKLRNMINDMGRPGGPLCKNNKIEQVFKIR